MDSFPSSGRFLARSLFRMSSHNPLLRLEQRAAEADQIIEYLKQQVQLLKEKASKMINELIRSSKASYLSSISLLFPGITKNLA